MNSIYPRILLLSCIALGCSPGPNGNKDSADASQANTGGASHAGTGGHSTGGAGGAAGTGAKGSSGTGGVAVPDAGPKLPTPPPEMPRKLGPADGVYCQSDTIEFPFPTCPVGKRCCPNASGTDPDYPVCSPDSEKCAPCAEGDCAQLRCDGPEDCAGGQFCCYASQGMCKNNPECVPVLGAEMSSWSTVECRTRCVGNDRDDDHGAVVCKDDHDCPGKYLAGRCRPLPPGQLLPNGIKICFGGAN